MRVKEKQKRIPLIDGNNIKILTNDKFAEIYTNEDFRNDVAYAHGHYDSGGKFKYKATCSYPIKYVVTEDQIIKAKKLIDKKRELILKTHKNDLLFVGMGSTYNTEKEIGNYRIRTEFLNSKGLQIFVEFSRGCKPTENGVGSFVVDHSVNRTKEIELKSSFDRQGDYYNYKGLERLQSINNFEYTPANILKIINDIFDCEFKKIIVDNYNISCDGIICESPQRIKNKVVNK